MSTSATLHEPQSTVARAQSAPLSNQSYAFLQSYIYRQSGIVLDRGKQYLIEARLLPIVRKENIISLDSLCQRLAANTSPALSRQVVEAMTTNETLFFRDVGMFEALKNALQKRRVTGIGQSILVAGAGGVEQQTRSFSSD